MKANRLVIVGDSAFAEIAKEYFERDSNYDVVGFSVEANFLKKNVFHGLPVVPFERIESYFPPADHDIFVAITYAGLNRIRTRLSKEAKNKGYALASYISKHAFLWGNVQIGEHCFIFENNTIQPFVKIANNVVLWSGNHIGHHSSILDNCFISSHVVISGFCQIGQNSFLGVNSTIANNLILGSDNWIGPGVTLTQSTKNGEVYSAPPVKPSAATSFRLFRIKE